MTGRLLKGTTGDVRIQLFRYFIVGGTAFAVDFGLLWVLAECGVHYLLAGGCSFAAGLSVNYLLSVAWVFRDHVLHSRLAEFAGFAAIGVAGLGLNEAVLWVATEAAGFHYLLSKIIAAAVVFLWNFAARKYLLFHGKK